MGYYQNIKKFLPFLALAVCLTGIVGLIFVVGQQSLRMSANDPQVQMAEDTAARLNQGISPAEAVAGLPRVDMASSLAPFVVIYDKSGRAPASSASLDNQVPMIPYGVLKNAEGRRYHAVTWQPQHDVRIASVTTAARGYYVLSGRSLTEVENRTKSLGQICLAGWVLLEIVLGVTYVVMKRLV